MSQHTAADVTATVKTLRARCRKVPAAMRHNAHFQIAKRRIADAVLFADRNTEHAVKCCWDARYSLNMLGAD